MGLNYSQISPLDGRAAAEGEGRDWGCVEVDTRGNVCAAVPEVALGSERGLYHECVVCG